VPDSWLTDSRIILQRLTIKYITLASKHIILKQKVQSEEMRKEKKSASADDKKKDLVLKLSRLSINDNVFEGSTDLPQVFQVRLS